MTEALSHEALAREVFGGSPEPAAESTAIHSNPFEETAREAFGLADDAGQPQPQDKGDDRTRPAGEGPATDADLAAVELPQDIKAVEHLPEVAAELSTFRKDARDLGLTKKQAAGVLDRFNAYNSRQEARLAQEARRVGEEDMKRAWGADFSARVGEAKAALNTLEARIPGLRRLANIPAVGNSRVFCELLRLAAGR